MENPIPQPAVQQEPKDERAEWVTPTVTDYDIEEATLSNHPSPPGSFDGTTYS